MSRHSRQDYHPYTQQSHARWSPSPPMNRLSNHIDPRLATRMGQQTQELAMQPQLPSSTPTSQLHQAVGPVAPTASTPAASAPFQTNANLNANPNANLEIVQAVQAMNAQLTSQLSIMGTQLASLVSLTSRLIEISQLSSASGPGAAGTGASSTLDSSEPDPARAQRNQSVSLNTTPAAPNASSGQQQGSRGSNRAQNGTLADGLALTSSALRPETRSGMYGGASGYRAANEAAATGSSLDRVAFGSTLRIASPSTSSASVVQLSGGGTANGRSQQQPPPPPSAVVDVTDSHKSRLPSPVFVDDDPIGMSSEPLAEIPQQTPTSTSAGRKQQVESGDRSNDDDASNESPSKKVAESTLGDWKDWLDRKWRPSAADQGRTVKYRTMQSARRAHKDMTKRSMATLGRLPLKEFLEIKPEQYLNVRKTGRKVYSEWLYQEVRLAKQPDERLTAAINRIENEHPALGDCDDHWKAKQLLQQIIDNAIDEANLHRKKEARSSNVNGAVSSNANQSTPRTTATGDSGRSRTSNLKADSVKKGASATPGGPALASKAAKTGTRRKADQADLEETPSRFRAPPAPASSSSHHAETTLSSSGSRRVEEQPVHTQHSLSSGLGDSSAQARSALGQRVAAGEDRVGYLDYSGYGNPDATSMASANSDQTRAAANNSQTNNSSNSSQGWPGPSQGPTSSLFSQSSYTQHQANPQQQHQHQQHQQQQQPQHAHQQQHQQQQQHPHQQQQQHHQQQHAAQQQQQQSTLYGSHHGNAHASHYLASDSHHHHHPSSACGLGSSSSSLLEPGAHDGHRAHSHSHLSPLLHGGGGGGVRLAANTASAQNAFAFDYRHHG